MSTGLRLGDYAATPLYNIKAVVQATGISPSTLRAWERRYNIARPHRSDSGYRLYSERDVAVIRWLKAQVEAGMSISQAVTWLLNITDEAGDAAHAILPTAGNGTALHDPLGSLASAYREAHSDEPQDFGTLQHELLLALTHYDEVGAEETIATAFALYPFEQVGDQLFLPVLQQISELDQRRELSSTCQHFASNYLCHRLGGLLRSAPLNSTGPLIWTGGARTDTLEAGALLLSVYLRRAGYNVHYLGQNLPFDEDGVKDLVQEARSYHPAMILLNATTSAAARKVGKLTAQLTQNHHLPAIIGYSGVVYAHSPELRAATAGLYVGADAREVIHNIDELLAERQRGDRKADKMYDKQVNGGTVITKAW